MHFDIQMTLLLILYAEEYNFGTTTFYNLKGITGHKRDKTIPYWVL